MQLFFDYFAILNKLLSLLPREAFLLLLILGDLPADLHHVPNIVGELSPLHQLLVLHLPLQRLAQIFLVLPLDHALQAQVGVELLKGETRGFRVRRGQHGRRRLSNFECLTVVQVGVVVVHPL